LTATIIEEYISLERTLTQKMKG